MAFTIARTLEAGSLSPDTAIGTAAGFMKIGPATVRDAHRKGPLTVAHVIQKRWNVGASKIALSLPAETMWKLFRGVGFGQMPKTGFPGEAQGKLRPYRSWRPIEQATMSFGHGISVSLLQLTRAYGVFANDGQLPELTFVKSSAAASSQQVISPETAHAVRHMLDR